MRKPLLKLSLNVIAALPLVVVQSFGALLGILAYLGSKQYRMLFRPQYDAVMQSQGLPKRLWEAIRGSGMLFSDSLWIWRNPEKALRLVEVQNWDLVESAVGEGHGLVMLTPHLGGFEIIPRVLAQHFPATILYRPSRQAWLNEVVEEGRAYPNMHFVPTNLNGVRQMTRALTRGEAIGILPDQVPPDGEGVWAPFFGKPAYTMTLVHRLQQLTGSPIFVLAAERKAVGKGYLLHCKRLEAPLPDDPEAAATIINQEMEALIRKMPEQYLWGYNRYRTPKTKALKSRKSD